MQSLDYVRFFTGAAFLLYATVTDLRTRRVPNRTWIALGTVAGLLFLVDALVTRRFDWHELALAAAFAGLAYGLWYFHLIAGGADAKALMALGALLPAPIQWDLAGRTWPWWDSFFPGAVVILANSVLLFLLAPVILLVRNLARGHLRFPAMLFGYRMPLSRAEASFVWIVDRVREDGSMAQVLFPSRTSDEDYLENVRRLREKGVESVWVTPKIPFMLPLLAGFVAAFFLGDILFETMRLLVGTRT